MSGLGGGAYGDTEALKPRPETLRHWKGPEGPRRNGVIHLDFYFTPAISIRGCVSDIQ